MNYELAKKLKELGFPFEPPSLSKLIAECGEKFEQLVFVDADGDDDRWRAEGELHHLGWGKTPEEAVANLWLALNKQ